MRSCCLRPCSVNRVELAGALDFSCQFQCQRILNTRFEVLRRGKYCMAAPLQPCAAVGEGVGLWRLLPDLTRRLPSCCPEAQVCCICAIHLAR